MAHRSERENRIAKVLDLEEIALASRIHSTELRDLRTRESLLRALAARRGKPLVNASAETWELLRISLAERERPRTRGELERLLATAPAGR